MSDLRRRGRAVPPVSTADPPERFPAPPHTAEPLRYRYEHPDETVMLRSVVVPISKQER